VYIYYHIYYYIQVLKNGKLLEIVDEERVGTEYESEWEKVFYYSFCYLLMLLPHATISAIEIWLALARQAEV
jgi:hypothetical protein